jgi:hypothetical protein
MRFESIEVSLCPWMLAAGMGPSLDKLGCQANKQLTCVLNVLRCVAPSRLLESSDEQHAPTGAPRGCVARR